MKINMVLKTLVVSTTLCLLLSAFSTKPGSHSFQVYLDDKLMIEQYVSSKMLVPRINIDPAENYTRLVVKYNECGRTVTGRKINIKDDRGNVLKEWNFEGSTSGYKDAMTCSVKDIQALRQKANGELRLYYFSADFTEGQQIATLAFGKRDTAAN